MANTRIAAAGTFSVAQLAAAVGNIVAFTNGTTASITGTVTMSGTGISGSFPLDLEAGETVLLRNNTVNNTYTYAVGIPTSSRSRIAPWVLASGKCGMSRLTAVWTTSPAWVYVLLTVLFRSRTVSPASRSCLLYTSPSPRD